MDKILVNTDYERNLGVWTSRNLTWTKHVECQRTLATKILGYITAGKFVAHALDWLAWIPRIMNSRATHRDFQNVSFL